MAALGLDSACVTGSDTAASPSFSRQQALAVFESRFLLWVEVVARNEAIGELHVRVAAQSAERDRAAEPIHVVAADDGDVRVASEQVVEATLVLDHSFDPRRAREAPGHLARDQHGVMAC